MPEQKILLIDDEPVVQFAVRDFLERNQFRVFAAGSAHGAQQTFRDVQPDAAIVDYLLPDGNALDLLPRLKEMDPSVPIVILTGHGSIDVAVRAIKEGADQFLTKPVELPALLVVIRRLLEARRDHRRQVAHQSLQVHAEVDPFVGNSEAIHRLKEHAQKVLQADSPILIQAETGTGKGVLAGWLHRRGPRGEEAFVDLNCAGFSKDLLESELMGHEKGAFTGALTSKAGLLEVAHRGTIFLDEIGDMDPQVQPKLLKVLEEKRFRRVGDVRDRQVDVRLVAATHRDLGVLVAEKQFRDDLFFRISTLPLSIPALRQRIEDIPLLARQLLRGIARDLGCAGIELKPDAEKALQGYHWPGNIRELRNVLERAVLFRRGDSLGSADLTFSFPNVAQAGLDTSLTLAQIEQRHIEQVLQEEHGNVEKASRRLGIPRSSLYQRIKKLGLAPSKT